MNLETVNDILDFAIKREMEAAQLYADLAHKAQTEEMKKFWLELEMEEINHKEQLNAMKHGKILNVISGKIMDIDILECTQEKESEHQSEYLKALIYAMRLEKSEFKLYSDLADIAENNELISTLKNLAQEEARHKLLLEIKYDEYLLVK